MTENQIEAMLRGPLNAVIGTNRRNGAPQLSPIWYIYEDGRFYISVGADSVKARNVRRDPRVSLCIDEGHPDGRAVTVDGTAELVEEASAWRDDLIWRIILHYHETEADARHYDATKPDTGPSVLIVVTPEKVFSHDTE
jgi:PPOX class probable F420-dependent enzyme